MKAKKTFRQAAAAQAGSNYVGSVIIAAVREGLEGSAVYFVARISAFDEAEKSPKKPLRGRGHAAHSSTSVVT